MSHSQKQGKCLLSFHRKATAFTSSTTTGSDSSPPTPADAVGETHFYAWDSMLMQRR